MAKLFKNKNGKIITNINGNPYKTSSNKAVQSNARLVATGSLNKDLSNRNSIVYDLTSKLEADKIYLILRYEDELGSDAISSFVATKRASEFIYAFNGSVIPAPETDTDSYISAHVFYYGSSNEDVSNIYIEYWERELYYSENDELKVYELPFSLNENGSSSGSSGSKFTLEDIDNGFTINLDAESGEIIIRDGTPCSASLTPYSLNISGDDSMVDLSLNGGVFYKEGNTSVMLTIGEIYTFNEEKDERYDFYFPKKSGTLALEDQMLEMEVDIIWDENNESFIDLGYNIIDWSKSVHFKLINPQNNYFFILEWDYLDRFIRYYPFILGRVPEDWGSIFNGCGFVSINPKEQDIFEQYGNSYIWFIEGNDEYIKTNICKYTKMIVYYYPTNEKSPTVYVEI